MSNTLSKARLHAGESEDLGDSVSELRISLVEVLGSTLLNLTRDWLHVASNVLDHVLALCLVDDVAEQIASLLEITVGVVGSVPADQASDSVGCISSVIREREGLERIGIVVLLVACIKK